MRKILIVMAAIFFSANVTFANPTVEIPLEIYRWVQSTPRGNYWFNCRVMGYKIRSDDTLDLNILEVPVVVTYDNIQIDDVVQKRKWRGQSIRGYNNLIGRADYLEFNLNEATVTIVHRDDLDNTFSPLDSEVFDEPINLYELSAQDVSCKLYRAILKWARENNDWIIERSRGKLNRYDSRLSPQNYPLFRLKWGVD